MSKAIEARRHYATGYFSNALEQSKKRALWEGVPPAEVYRLHKVAEYETARDHAAHCFGTPLYDYWLAQADALSADLDRLDEPFVPRHPGLTRGCRKVSRLHDVWSQCLDTVATFFLSSYVWAAVVAGVLAILPFLPLEGR